MNLRMDIDATLGETPETLNGWTRSAEDGRSGLAAAIQRLCGIVNETEQTVDSEDAEEIVNDLDTLLRQTIDANRRSNDSYSGLKRAKKDDCLAQVRKVRGTFDSTTEVNINRSCTYLKPLFLETC